MKIKMHKNVKLFFKILFTTTLVTLTIAILIFLAAVFGLIDTTADLDLENLKLSYTSTIYYNDPVTAKPVEYQRLFAQENRMWVSLDKMPKMFQNAVVAIEDERFYQHIGVDFMSTSKAVWDYITRSNGRGASTITQQLVKNLTGDDEVDIARKVTEMVRALNVERKLSKDQILELYLNTIYLGNGCYGVSTAANLYMNKEVEELTLAEAALIAGITQYPSKYDPIHKFDESKEKQELVLAKMLELGYITQRDHDAAVAEKLDIHNTRKVKSSSQSYFVDQIINDVHRDLVAQKGCSDAVASKMIYSGGLKIYSTVDMTIQTAMNEVFVDPKNFPKVKGETTPQSAMLVIDPLSGAVRGISGGMGPKEGDRILNRATQSLRQPGSTIKPIGVYAPALEKGIITPYSVYDDKPIKMGNWSPKNYYNGFRGSMTVKTALEQSVNTVAIQVLEKVGIDYSFDFLSAKLGMTTLVDSEQRSDGKMYSDKYPSSLALGGVTDGVSLLELAGAYSAFANKGIYTKPYTYTMVVDHTGKTILENGKQTTIAMSAETAYTMNTMMKGVVTNGTGTSANFNRELDICGKTGTTDNDVDRWFVGYTPYYVGVVWYGYDTPKPMDFLTENPTIPVWKKVMEKVHEDLPNAKFTQPEGFKAPSAQQTSTYCSDSNKKPTSACANDPRGSRVRYGTPPNGEKPTSYCTLHKKVRFDNVTKKIATNGCPTTNVTSVVIRTDMISGGSIKVNGEPYSYSTCTQHPAVTTPPDESPSPTSETSSTGSPTSTTKPSETPTDPPGDTSSPPTDSEFEDERQQQ